MTLNLNEKETYADPYVTNWGYLDSMTELQVKLLEVIRWYEEQEYIYTVLLDIPWAWNNKENVKGSVERFIPLLHASIMRL
jgi:hypothetical protein